MSGKQNVARTALYGTVCTVVWEDGGREPSSYPIRGASTRAVIAQLIRSIDDLHPHAGPERHIFSGSGDNADFVVTTAAAGPRGHLSLDLSGRFGRDSHCRAWVMMLTVSM